jgi:hypothetical protein
MANVSEVATTCLLPGEGRGMPAREREDWSALDGRTATLSSKRWGGGSQNDRLRVCGGPDAQAATALVRRDEDLAESRGVYRMALQLSASGANGERWWLRLHTAEARPSLRPGKSHLRAKGISRRRETGTTRARRMAGSKPQRRRTPDASSARTRVTAGSAPRGGFQGLSAGFGQFPWGNASVNGTLCRRSAATSSR